MKEDDSAAVKAEKEGWQAEKPYSQRVYHYIVGTFSLCGRLGFYMGEVTAHAGGKGRADCSECYRRVEKRLALSSKAEDAPAK
jgi:hypothetical protein